MSTLPDVQNREDLAHIVTTFYEIAWQDPVLHHIFTEVTPLDLPTHIPVVTDFWESVVFRTGTYTRGAFGPHVAVHHKQALGRDEFARWLACWNAAVHRSYAGEVAEKLVHQASLFAAAFERRLQSAPEMEARDVVQGANSDAEEPEKPDDMSTQHKPVRMQVEIQPRRNT